MRNAKQHGIKTARSARAPRGTPIPIPIFAPWLIPESLVGGLSGFEVEEVVGADVVVEESSVVEALLALDERVEVGHAVDGPYWTMR